MMFKREEKTINDNEAMKFLPHTRKEVFFDLIKHRKMTLFALSSFVFMFFIPLAIDLIYFNFLEASVSQDKPEYLFSLIFYSMLIMLPCMILGFIGLYGGFYVAKKLVWQEGISLAQDFFKGIKENWLHGLVNGLIFGIILFGFVVGGYYLIIYAPLAPIWSGIGIGALTLLVLFFGMSISLVYTQDVYYSNPYLVTLKNAFRFLALLNWKILVLFVLSTGVVIGLCYVNNLIMIVVGLFLFAILNSVVIVLYTLISHAGFDRFINFEHYPDMVGKGLYKKE